MVFDSSPNALLLVDQTMRIGLVNRQLATQFGFAPGALIGRPIEDFLPRGLPAGPVESRPGEESVALHQSGDLIPVQLGMAPVETGEGHCTIVTVIDLTDRKRADERLRNYQLELEAQVAERSAALQEANAFLNSVVENIPDMIFVKDAKNLRFVRFNKAGEELLGYSRDQMLGKSDYDFFPKEEADVFTGQDRAVLAGRRVVELPENVITTRAHGQRYLHSKKMPILGSDGEPQYLLGISEDITDRKVAEEAREQLIREQARTEESQREQRRWKFLADASRILTSSLDYETTAESLARLAATDFGDWCLVLDRELKPVAIAAADPEKARLVAAFLKTNPVDPKGETPSARVLRTGKSLLLPNVADDTSLSASDDPAYRRMVEQLGFSAALVVPLTMRGQTVGTIAISWTTPGRSFDEADLELAEEFARRASTALDNARLYAEAQRAIRLREDFMAIASHELKTPLTPLKLQLQLLRRMLKGGAIPAGPRSPELLKLVETSDKHIQRLTRLVDDLLEVSRISSGRMTLNPEQLDLCSLVEEIVDRFGPETLAAGCTIALQLHGPVVGTWDRMRLEQVVINLLTNALKYGAGGRVRIDVSGDQQQATLTMQDSGIGIAAEDQERIFGRFERAVSVQRFGGLGLGLYIARLGVESHGGVISVESQPGQGACFTVRLPLHRPAGATKDVTQS